MQRAVSVETMRNSDAWTIANLVPSKELMRRAGEGIYKSVSWKAPVAVVCGSGNNAGDGYVVADLLHKDGIDCTIILLSEKFSEDGKYFYDICMKDGVRSVLFDKLNGGARPATSEESNGGTGPDTFDGRLSGYATVLDCILGTGFSGDVRGKAKDAIEAINSSGAYVVSADINSGLNGDTGMGITFVRSDLTVSIGDYKLGHFKGMAKEAVKDKVNVDIGIMIQGEFEYFE